MPAVVAVVVVVLLGVFLLRKCQSDAQTSAYHSYVDKVNAVVSASNGVGNSLQTELFGDPAATPSKISSELAALVQRHRQVEVSAARFNDTGDLNGLQIQLERALRYRTNGLQQLRGALLQALGKNGATAQNLDAVSAAYARLLASDVIYDDEFRTPGQAGLTRAGIHDAQIAASTFAREPDLVAPTSSRLVGMVGRIAGSAPTASGATKCVTKGTQIDSVTMQPGDIRLTPNQTVNVKSRINGYTFQVTVTNGGDCQLVQQPVHLIQQGNVPQSKQVTIDPGQQVVVTFPSGPATFATTAQKVTVTSVPVKGETDKSNNSFTYLIHWST